VFPAVRDNEKLAYPPAAARDHQQSSATGFLRTVLEYLRHHFLSLARRSRAFPRAIEQDLMTSFSRRIQIVTAASLLVACAAFFSYRKPAIAFATPAAADPAPDLIVVNGRILTVDAKDSIAEALAVRAGKIVAVGSNAKIQSHATKATRVIDLHGRTATPGLIDSHGHFADGGVNELYFVSLSDAPNIEDVLRRVRERAATRKPGEWIVGTGWDEGKLSDHRYVYASDLDRAAPNNPAWLMHTTGHYGACNTAALKLAHITASTPNPAAGTIDRDAQGAPSGVLKESAMHLVTDLIPPTSPEQEHNAILHIIDALHREGMTAVKDASIAQHTWDAYRRVFDEGKLTVRVFTLWYAGTTMDSARDILRRLTALPRPPQSLGEGRLFAGGAKMYMDGSGGARTAWVYKDWNKNSTDTDTGNKGYPAINPELYRQQVRLFHQAGIHVGTHAVGDRAIDSVVDTYQAVLKEKPTRGLRHSVIHANIPTDHALNTIASLEKEYDAGYLELSAPFLWWLGDVYAGNFGPERSARLIPLKTYRSKGIIWTGSSDYFVTPFAARYGIWASVVRETLKGVYGAHPFGTAESVDVHTALRSYTLWAAHQLFLDDKIGSLEPGKRADIAVWDRDPYAVPAADLKDMKCEMTLFDGQLVYKSASTPIESR
jgi:predicted amidohydrolase YtcJ